MRHDDPSARRLIVLLPQKIAAGVTRAPGSPRMAVLTDPATHATELE